MNHLTKKEYEAMKLSLSSHWDIKPEYKFEKCLGNGTYGEVCQAHCLSTGTKVAIKKISNVFVSPQLCKRTLREIELLSILSHPGIVKSKGILFKSPDLYLIEELAETDLRKILNSSTCLSSVQIKYLMYSIIAALNYIHSGGVVHRDIKPGNILIDSNGIIKICDFGLSRALAGLESGQYDCALAIRRDSICIHEEGEFPETALKIREQKEFLLKKNKETASEFQRELSGHVATRWYRSPELILVEKVYSTAVDIWAVGCIFSELLWIDQNRSKEAVGRKPMFPGDSCFPLSPKAEPDIYAAELPISTQDQLIKILEIKGALKKEDIDFITDRKAEEYVKALGNKKKRISLNKIFPWAEGQAINLLEKMLAFNPYRRITAKEALEHPYFSVVRDKALETEFAEPITLMTDKKNTMDMETLAREVISEIKKR